MTSITNHNGAQIKLIASEADQGQRIDKMLSAHLRSYSRSAIQLWLKSGCVLNNGRPTKPSAAVQIHDVIEVTIPVVEPLTDSAQALALDIVYEDESILVVNKPAGLVVHPGAGNPDHTLLNGLLHYDSGLELLPRGGIVHRLDKDTSGLMVVARTESARQNLVSQLADRSVKRRYVAIVYGTLVAGGTVDAPIGRHPKVRVKMAVVGNGKPAITHYRIGAKYRHTTQLDVTLETGRTHQIRVHLASIGLPLIGDPVYGKRVHLPRDASEEFIATLQAFKRQALHAIELGLLHPDDGEMMSWTAQMPDDLTQLQSVLQADTHRALQA